MDIRGSHFREGIRLQDKILKEHIRSPPKNLKNRLNPKITHLKTLKTKKETLKTLTNLPAIQNLPPLLTHLQPIHNPFKHLNKPYRLHK